MKVRRKLPILFPDNEKKKSAPYIPVKMHDLRLGANFRVGNPANGNYLFLWNSLKRRRATFNDSNLQSKHMVDQIVTITGLLKSKNNSYTAILERKDKIEFSKGIFKVYADVDNAVIAQELISL